MGWKPFRPRGHVLTHDTKPLAERIAEIAAEKLATDIVILDMREVVGYTDWFVIMTGRNTRQTQAIGEEIALRLKRDHGRFPQRVEGQREGTWILLDYLDAIVHVFTAETRDYYRLEHLWGQVPAEAFEAKTA